MGHISSLHPCCWRQLRTSSAPHGRGGGADSSLHATISCGGKGAGSESRATARANKRVSPGSDGGGSAVDSYVQAEWRAEAEVRDSPICARGHRGC
eukprot:6180803-Pleurochrysis_carterae.AAC.1